MRIRRVIVVGIIAVLLGSVFFMNFVSASSSYDGLAINTPSGSSGSPTVISGTYTFTATMTVGAGESYSVSNGFVINGVSVTPSVTVVFTKSTYSEYRLTYSYVTGQLSNGEYSWYASVTIGGTVFRAPTSGYDYFQVNNFITIAISSPTSGSTVANTVQVFVTTQPSSTNTVSSVSGTIASLSLSFVSQGNNVWSSSFNSHNAPNGVFQLAISAVGSDSTSGNAAEPLTIGNTGPSQWEISYATSFGTYTSYAYPQMTGQLSTEGPITTQLGQLPVDPNSATTSVTLTTPNTLPSMDVYYFPLDASPYYQFTSTSADNWVDPASNPLTMSNVVVGNSSPYNTPSITTSSTATSKVTNSLGFGPTNISKGQWTVGFIFYATGSGILFGNGYTYVGTSFVSGTSGPFYIYLQLSNSSGSSSQYDLQSNMSFNENTWYSIAWTFNNANGSNIYSYTTVRMFVDGQQSGYKITTAYSGSQGFTGFGTTLFNNQLAETLAGMYVVSTILSDNQITQMMLPAPWQIYTYIQPSYITISQTYYSVKLTNGSEPWSSLGVFVSNTIAGQQSQVSLSLTSVLGIQPFFYYRIEITYSPFMSLNTFVMNLSYNPFFIPLDSFATIRVYNDFNQRVGILSNYEIQDANVPIIVRLDLTQVSFNVVNSVQGQVNVAANGITQIAFSSIILANNTVYNFSTQVFINGNMQTIYGAPNVTSAPYQTVSFYASPPDASLLVTVFGYGNVGLLSSGGQPRINLYIDGSHYATDSTFNGILGEVVNVTIKDVTNQTLYSSNYTLLNIENSLVVNITTPSFILEFQNAEQAPSGSVLATEIINISTPLSSPKYYYNATASIGQTQTLYLKNGTYHVYIHDNATFSQNITLNHSEYWVIFGQKLVSLAQFTTDINRILNNSAHLQVVAVSESSSSSVDTPLVDNWSISLPNNVPLTQSQLYSLISNSSFSIYNTTTGTSILSPTLTRTLPNNLVASFTSPSKAGSYTARLIGYVAVAGSIYGMNYSYTFINNNIINFSVGLTITISGPSAVQVSTNATYLISLMFTNGTIPSSKDTKSILANMSADVYFNGVFVSLLHPQYKQPGQILATLDISANGSYVVVVSVSHTKITSSNVTAQQFVTISIVPYNPTGPNSWGQLVNFLSLNADIFGIGTALVAIAYFIYRRLRRRPLAKKAAVNDSENIIISNVIRRAIEVDSWAKLTPTDRTILSRLDAKTLHKIIFNLTGENRKTVSAMMEQIQQKNSKWKESDAEVRKVYRKVRQEI